MAGASILHFARMNHAMPIRATGHSNDAPNGFMTNAPMPAPKMDAAMPRAFLPALNFGGGATAGSVRRVSVPPRARHLRPAGAPAQAGAGRAAALRDGHQLGHLACRFPVLEALVPHQCVLPAGRREQKIPKLFERDRARLGVVINVIPSVRHLPTPVLRSGFRFKAGIPEHYNFGAGGGNMPHGRRAGGMHIIREARLLFHRAGRAATSITPPVALQALTR